LSFRDQQKKALGRRLDGYEPKSHCGLYAGLRGRILRADESILEKGFQELLVSSQSLVSLHRAKEQKELLVSKVRAYLAAIHKHLLALQ